jgi:hypothetical protein
MKNRKEISIKILKILFEEKIIIPLMFKYRTNYKEDTIKIYKKISD